MKITQEENIFSDHVTLLFLCQKYIVLSQFIFPFNVVGMYVYIYISKLLTQMKGSLSLQVDRYVYKEDMTYIRYQINIRYKIQISIFLYTFLYIQREIYLSKYRYLQRDLCIYISICLYRQVERGIVRQSFIFLKNQDICFLCFESKKTLRQHV